MRNALLPTAALALLLASPLQTWAATEAGHHAQHAEKGVQVPEGTPLAPMTNISLSPEQKRVSDIALQNGDKTFVMIDKAGGRILVWEDGVPVWKGGTLTGYAAADKYPAYLLAKPDTYKFKPDEKITPAGRFTLRRGYDPELGPVYEIVEVHGKDWWIAIHKVWTGIPAEHRAERLASGDPAQAHVSFGCINVSGESMRFLLQRFPKGMKLPVYVLPNDVNAIETFFPQHVSDSGRQTQAAK